ncbi:MAG: TPM domain-containing protein [Gemmatales bacterium]|nr:TPM domain-containing protein [Gemmatales bacterium]
MSTRPVRCGIALVLSAVLMSVAQAQVFDEAKMFRRETLVQADKQLRQLGQQYRLTLVVETFAQPPADVAQLAKIPEKRAIAFRHWAEQRRAVHQAHLYILLCRQPGRFEIVWHESLAPRLSREQAQVLRQTLLQHLQAKEFDQALREALQLIEKILAGQPAVLSASKPSEAQDAANDGQTLPTDETASRRWSWVFWALLAGAGVLVLGAILRGLVHAFGQRPGYDASVKTPSETAPGTTPAPPPDLGGAGSFLGPFLAGMFGAAVGSWLYHRFFRSGESDTGQEFSRSDPSITIPHESPANSADAPVSRYAPESGKTWTIGDDFDNEVTSNDTDSRPFDDAHEDFDSLDAAAEDYDAYEPDYDGGDLGGDLSGFDYGGTDCGGDF